MRTFLVENTWLNFSSHGWGNGYVLIPKGHPFHGKHYDDIDVDVHGGLTFSELVDAEMVKNWNENDLTKSDIGSLVIGFDTCHFGDNKEKWPKEAVQKEAENLLDQIKNYSLQNKTP